MTTHECARPGCATQVQVDRLACFRDWGLLPRSLQQAINRAWHERLRGVDGAAAAHEAAKRAAVAYWGRP